MKMDWKHFNDNTNNEGVEGRWRVIDEDHLIFYISGTNSSYDWKSNFTVKMVDYKGTKVNAIDLYEGQWCVDFISNLVDMNSIKKVTVGGHSRGGAAAQIMVARLLDLYPHLEVQGILLASKKAGNHNFAAMIERYCIAFKHRGDIIPHLPFNIPLLLPYVNVYHKRFGFFTFRFTACHLPANFAHIMDKYHLR